MHIPDNEREWKHYEPIGMSTACGELNYGEYRVPTTTDVSEVTCPHCMWELVKELTAISDKLIAEEWAVVVGGDLLFIDRAEVKEDC